VDGNIVAFTNVGSISQTLGTSLAADTIYKLSVLIGDRLDGANGIGNYTIALNAGSTPLCSFSGSSSSPSITAGTFADETCSFQSGSVFPSGHLSIVLTGGSAQVDFDKVSLTTTSVPEPSSLVLTGSGLLFAMLLFAYSKRKQFRLALERSHSTIA
jgi:hapalindole biogenesis HpiC1 cyclase-like protein